MVRSLATLCLAFAAACVALPAAAQWKWKDKSGHTQYSDLPPPLGTPEQDILSRPTKNRTGVAASSASAVAAASAPASVARSGDAELEAKRKKAEADLAARAKLDEQRVAAARADNCSRARAQLSSLNSGIRLARTNDKGEREILDDNARAGEVKRAQDAIATDCK